jgi:hypothetical protein
LQHHQALSVAERPAVQLVFLSHGAGHFDAQINASKLIKKSKVHESAGRLDHARIDKRATADFRLGRKVSTGSNCASEAEERCDREGQADDAGPYLDADTQQLGDSTLYGRSALGCSRAICKTLGDDEVRHELLLQLSGAYVAGWR